MIVSILIDTFLSNYAIVKANSQKIPTIMIKVVEKKYLVVDQYQPYATSYLKVAENTWRTHTVMSFEDTLPLESIDCTLALKQVYRNVEFG